MLSLLRSVTTEGDTLPFMSGADSDLIDTQWLGAVGCVLASGFRAMQFNQVVATNAAALALYRSFGFKRVGKITEAFAHPVHGYVPAYVMYLDLIRHCPRIQLASGESAQ